MTIDILDYVDYISHNIRETMKLSTRAQYGTRALLDLAIHGGNGPVPVRDIARRQQISATYLEHLVTPLIAAGIIRSVRGARGGIWLNRPPRQIKLNEVVQLLEGSIAPVECVSDPEYCSRSGFCVTRDVWSELGKAMNGVLESITLQDLVERQKEKAQLQGAMYFI